MKRKTGLYGLARVFDSVQDMLTVTDVMQSALDSGLRSATKAAQKMDKALKKQAKKNARLLKKAGLAPMEAPAVKPDILQW